jgi:hypothetical protein
VEEKDIKGNEQTSSHREKAEQTRKKNAERKESTL